MNIFRRMYLAVKLARTVATMAVCAGCRRPYAGDGVTFKGRPFCSLLCVPAVLRMESDRDGDLSARARGFGL